MNEHLTPIFEIIIPAMENAGISYWLYGGVAIAGIRGDYVRENPDVDVFVMNDDYYTVLGVVAPYEKKLCWKPRDANPLRGRPKRDWHHPDRNKSIFSVVPVYKVGDRVRFVFGHDFVPENILTIEPRKINGYTFNTPSIGLIKELLIDKSNEPRLTRDRRRKLKKDAQVIMSDSEFQKFCNRLDSISAS